MENLYKVNDYPGKLPNPMHFPIQGATIYAIKDKPYAFADGFMLDLSVKETDREMLRGKAIRTTDISHLGGLLNDGKRSELLLSEPEFIYDTTYLAYVLFTPSGNPIIVQVKYHKYFRNRYPECKFYIRDEYSNLIAVKLNKEVVGLCMQMWHKTETLDEIKEERK